MRIILLCLLFPTLIFPDIVINEIMCNVKGNDSGIGSPGDRNEFVELYNNGNDSIDLSKLRICDKDAIDIIIPWTDTVQNPGGIINTSILPPKKFAIILDPEYVDSGDGDYYMPYILPEDCYVFTINNTTIGNGLSSTDYLILLDENDSIIDSYGTPDIDDNIPYDPGDGISIERINPFLPDNENAWLSSIDINGCTPGYINSNYFNGTIVCSLDVNYNQYCDIKVFLFSTDYTMNDYLFIEGADFTDSILIKDSIIDLQFNKQNQIINIFTKTDSSKYSILLDNVKYKNTLIINEFMLQQPQWLELYNPYQLDFYAKNLKIINNDTIIIPYINIPQDSYIVVSDDTNTVKGMYTTLNLNLYENEIINLPKRIDTIILNYNGYTIDSIIRGYEDYEYRSIERVCYEAEGYILNNWDVSTDELKATPSSKNSLFRYKIISDDSIYIDKNIITDKEPIIYISLKTQFNNCYITCNIFNQLGELITKPYDNYFISGNTILVCKLDLSMFYNDIYIMYIEIKSNEKSIIRKFPIAIRK